MGLIWFFLGFFLGGFCGVVVFALVSASRYYEEDIDGKDEGYSDSSI